MADSADNSKAPSPKARQAARQQGHIAISSDLATGISLVSSLVVIYLYSPKIFQAATKMLQSQLGSVSIQTIGIADDAVSTTLDLVSVVGQCVIAVAVLVAAVWLVQTGALFAIQRIIPDIARVSPAAGLQKLFSVANLITATLNLLKLAIVAGASYFYFRSNLETFAAISQSSLTTIARDAGTLLYHLALLCTGSLIAVGVVDYTAKRVRYEAGLSEQDDDARSSIRSIRNDPSTSQRRLSTNWAQLDSETPSQSDSV